MTVARLRNAVVDSHLPEITVAILLFELIETAFVVVHPTFSHILWGVARNIEMRHDPFFHPPLDNPPDYALLLSQLLGVAFLAGFSFLAAWVLCRWAYDAGPFNCLVELRSRLKKQNKEEPNA